MANRLQEIFDKSVAGLIKQGRPSINAERNCVYRSPDGAACAAGQLIPNEEYVEAMENVRSDKLPFFLNNYNEEEIQLIRELQIAHDSIAIFYPNNAFVKELKNTVKAIGEAYNLSLSCLQTKSV